MKVTLLLHDKFVYADGAIREMVLRQLPAADAERPHGLEYRLHYGKLGERLIGYDNERDKGNRRHHRDHEGPYPFESVEKLVQDFRNDIERERR